MCDIFVSLYQGFVAAQKSKKRAKSYLLQAGLQLQDITQKMLLDKNVPAGLKQPLINDERHIVIFKYLSGSEYVARYFSYLKRGDHPVMIILRGDNGFFGIMRPNNRFSFLKNYNVVFTFYRGNIFGGKDEFGGEDVKDVENLLKFFPEIERFSHTKMQAP